MSTQDFLARSAFNDLEASIELALSQTEGFRDEAENFADLARRGIRLVGVVANLSSFPANPEDGDAVLVESETQIYFWDAGSSTWKNSQIVGSAIWGNVQGTLSDQTDLQTALDDKADVPDEGVFDAELSTTGDPFASITYTRNNGLYQVIGGYAHVYGYIQINAVDTTGASGNVIIQAPFTAASNPIFIYSGYTGREGGFGIASTEKSFVEIQLGTNNISLRKSNGGQGAQIPASDITSNFILSFSIKYKTA